VFIFHSAIFANLCRGKGERKREREGGREGGSEGRKEGRRVEM
jgi:hypothetical protein